jgi:hypothetical protein
MKKMSLEREEFLEPLKKPEMPTNVRSSLKRKPDAVDDEHWAEASDQLSVLETVV